MAERVKTFDEFMNDKQLPDSDDPMEYVRWIRERATGHAPGYDIAIYARPTCWLQLATVLERYADIANSLPKPEVKTALTP